MHFRLSRIRWIAATLGLTAYAAAAIACSGAEDAPGTAENAGTADEALYGLGKLGTLWPNHTVPVCFADMGHDNILRSKIPGILANSWSTAADITFTGFGACGTGNQITVKFAILTDDASTGGPDYRGSTDNLGAGQRFITLVSDDSPDLNHFTYEVIHEFGHALGFAHEMKRPDNWPTSVALQCGKTVSDKDYAQCASADGGVYLTATYDPNSMMNYCNPAGLPTVLSAGDISGASSANAYGPSKVVPPAAPQKCGWTFADCHKHITFSCDVPVSPRNGDHNVLKRDRGAGDYEIVATDPYDFVDYSTNDGSIVNFKVCTENGLFETCTSPIAVSTVPTESCTADGSGGDPGNWTLPAPTCGKPPLKKCPTLTQNPNLGQLGR